MYVLCQAQRCNGRAGLATLWKDREIKLVTVSKTSEGLGIPLLYEAKTWMMRNAERKKIDADKMPQWLWSRVMEKQTNGCH